MSKKIIYMLISLGVFLIIIFISISIKADIFLGRKIEFSSDLSGEVEEEISKLVMDDEYTKGLLKDSKKLLINNDAPNFCDKNGEKYVTGKFKGESNVGSLYISFIKKGDDWEICTTGTSP